MGQCPAVCLQRWKSMSLVVIDPLLSMTRTVWEATRSGRCSCTNLAFSCPSVCSVDKSASDRGVGYAVTSLVKALLTIKVTPSYSIFQLPLQVRLFVLVPCLRAFLRSLLLMSRCSRRMRPCSVDSMEMMLVDPSMVFFY